MHEDKLIQQKSAEIIGETEFLLLEVKIRKRKNQKFIEVFIDGEEDITLDDCALISRSLTDAFDAIIPPDSYQIDVSSPGADRPLRFLKQFPKHIGRTFELHYTDKEGVKRGIDGTLEEVEENSLWFAKGNEKLKIPFDSISKAKVKVSF